MNGPMGLPPAQGLARAGYGDEDAALRRVCAELEGVFFEQVLKAMRETIPEGGVIDGGLGEDIFSGMMDAHLATLSAERVDGSIAAALYRQLRGGAL